MHINYRATIYIFGIHKTKFNLLNDAFFSPIRPLDPLFSESYGNTTHCFQSRTVTTRPTIFRVLMCYDFLGIGIRVKNNHFCKFDQ